MLPKVATQLEEEQATATVIVTEEEIYLAAVEIVKALPVGFPRALELQKMGYDSSR